LATPGSRRVILDTSVLVASDANLSDLICQISSVSYAELHFGVQGAPDDSARLSRQHRLTMIQSVYGHGIAFTDDTAHHYGLLCGRLRAQGRSPRGRAMDVMIAATALTLGVPLVTRNTDDVDRLGVELLQR
jgi:predicted nucleic acid-binding protein